MAKNPYAAYKSMKVATSSPAQRIVMVYKALIRHLEQAAVAFDDTDPQHFETVFNHINAAGRILTELQVSLDKNLGGEVAVSLEKMYAAWKLELSKVCSKNDRESLELVTGAAKEVLESWENAERSLRGAGPTMQGGIPGGPVQG